jgi:hypothetical protein
MSPHSDSKIDRIQKLNLEERIITYSLEEAYQEVGSMGKFFLKYEFATFNKL